MHAPRHLIHAAFCSLAFALGPALAAAQNGVAENSPFMPAGKDGAPTASEETLEFAGVSVVGKKTDLIIHDKATKKSRWIPLGATVDGISAVSYDPRQEQAVIRANGTEKTLALRKPSGPVNAPAPVLSAVPVNTPPPVAVPLPAMPPSATDPALGAGAAASQGPATPATPESIARQETEARMLVSDLLEIGMAQRKAYEEAQRKAAQGIPPQPPGANPPVPTASPAAPAQPATPPAPPPNGG